MVKRRGVWHSRAPPPLSLGLVYDPAVSGTAVLTLSIISAAARGCSRVRPLSRITFEVVRGVELYDAAVSGTAVPAPPLLTACTHSRVTFEVVRGVELYDAAVSGTAAPAPPLLTSCTHCFVRVSSCWIRRYPLLVLVAVLSGRCCGDWHVSALSLAA